ncbi:MAG: hypothetical protein WB715_08875 [Roseiarcus sp.]|uniref:hypothetical protein n=1 Tax=Roseiarcus sp. TaxID=1969460 RepID=UPI003C6BC63E
MASSKSWARCERRLDCPYRIRLTSRTMGSSWASLVSWAGFLLAVATPLALFSFRTLIVGWITKGVEHDFNVKLENLRATLKTSEERLKSDLREKEAEIGTLRSSVLSGSAGRQALLDKRRFESVEKIWTAVNDSARLRALAQTMAILNYGAVAKETRNPKMQQFLEMVEAVGPDVKELKNVARDERPFVPELTWAYYSAFSTVLHFSLLRLHALKSGLADPQEVVTSYHIKEILKAALPHQSKFIDENDPGAYYYLLDELELRLLSELRKILDGKEADQSSIQQATNILKATKAANFAQANDGS